MILWHDYIHTGDGSTKEKNYLKSTQEFIHYFGGGYLKHFFDHSYFLAFLILDNLFLSYSILPKHPMTSLIETPLKYVWENKKSFEMPPMPGATTY